MIKYSGKISKTLGIIQYDKTIRYDVITIWQTKQYDKQKNMIKRYNIIKQYHKTIGKTW